MSDSPVSPFPSLGQAGADPGSIPLEKIDVSDPELFETDTLWGYLERLRRENPVQRVRVSWVAGGYSLTPRCALMDPCCTVCG